MSTFGTLLIFSALLLGKAAPSFAVSSKNTFTPNYEKVWTGIHCRQGKGSVWFSSRKNRFLTGAESFSLSVNTFEVTAEGKFKVQGTASGQNCELFSRSPLEYIVLSGPLAGVPGLSLSLRTDQSTLWAEHYSRADLRLRNGISFDSEISPETLLNEHQLRKLRSGEAVKLFFYLDFSFQPPGGKVMHNWFELSLLVKRSRAGKPVTEFQALNGPFGNRTDY